MEPRHNHLLLEQVKGYVKALEISASRLSIMREVFERCAQNSLAGGKGLKVVLLVLPVVQTGEPS